MEYVINKSFNSKVERTPRVMEVAESFGLGIEDEAWTIYDNLKLEINQGDVVYITGQSGSGKSVILRELAAQMAKHLSVKTIDDVVLDHDKTLIDQIGKTTTEGLGLMNVAGLNDAYLFIRKPSELSDGQRYRLRIAKLVESGAQVWVADEFGAVLDRTTAMCISNSLQRAARNAGATLLVATTHSDLHSSSKPDITITKLYKERVAVEVHGESENE